MSKKFQDSSDEEVRESVNKSNARDDRTKSNKKRSNKQRRGRGNKSPKQEKDSTYASNDVTWYAKNPQVLQSAANLSYYTPVGGSFTFKNLPVESTGYSFPTLGTELGVIPGVMALEYVHGPASDANFDVEPLDIAANSIYSFIRHANSGAKNYDSPDLMMYLLAMDEVYQAWAIGVRAYGLMRLYSQTNRYLPKMLVEAAGFDFDDLSGNLANFNNYLNVLAAQISTFCVPANIPYFRRHFFLASNVYMDEDIQKPQMYLHRPALYRYWSDFQSDQGSTLVAGWWPYHDQFLGAPDAAKTYTFYGDYPNVVSDPESTYNTAAGNKALYQQMKMTFRQYKSIMDNMLYQLNGSSDIGLMSGDIKKAYGDSNLFTISPIPTDYVVVPVKQEEVLTQISNFKAFVGFNYYDTDANFHNSMDIRQVVGTETQSPQIDYNPSTTAHEAKLNLVPNIINFHKASVTPEDTMVASRWLALLSQTEVRNEQETLLGYHYDFWSVGSEFGIGIYVYSRIPDGATMRNETVTETVYHFASVVNNAMKLQSLIENFDWHMPIFTCGTFPTTPTDAVTVDSMLLDVGNFTFPGSLAISNMNQAAILSLFDVPELGKF